MNNRPVKVLAVCHAVRRNFNVNRPEAAQIAGIHNSGAAEVTVMCNPGSVVESYFREQNIRVVNDPLDKKFSARTIRAIRSELRHGGYDVLHLFNNTAISNGAFAAIGLPVKVVAYRGQTGNTSRWDPTSYLGILHPRIDMVIGVAQAVTDYVREQQFGTGHAETVYKGHDLDWYNLPAADLSELGLPNNAVKVSLVADMRPRKGLHVLMAATRYFDPAADIRILLVGAQPDDEQVRAQIDAAIDPTRVYPLGYRKDAPEVAQASDIVVLPTTKREGLSRAVIEGMAYGRPAVVTATGGNAELVADGICGLVVPPEDPQALGMALSKLALDRDLRERMGAAARERIATQFTVGQGVAKTLALYQNLLGQNPQP